MSRRWAVRKRFGRWLAYRWTVTGALDLTPCSTWREAMDYADREARR